MVDIDYVTNAKVITVHCNSLANRMREKSNEIKPNPNTYRTSGCASSMARINVVPDRGTPPMKINGICR